LEKEGWMDGYGAGANEGGGLLFIAGTWIYYSFIYVIKYV
jgi:hypothetical protein